MIILHPWSSGRTGDKLETWRTVAKARDAGYDIVSRNINRPMDYADLLKEFWGKDDLIVWEDDKVPTMADLKELVECRHAYCCFPHPVSFYFYTPMSLWGRNFPYTLGFVKFSKLVQENVPVSDWLPPDPAHPSPGWGLDRRIEEPMIKRFGPMHLHPRMIRHNHNRSIKGRLGGLKYQLSQAIRW